MEQSPTYETWPETLEYQEYQQEQMDLFLAKEEEL